MAYPHRNNWGGPEDQLAPNTGTIANFSLGHSSNLGATASPAPETMQNIPTMPLAPAPSQFMSLQQAENAFVSSPIGVALPSWHHANPSNVGPSAPLPNHTQHYYLQEITTIISSSVISVVQESPSALQPQLDPFGQQRRAYFYSSTITQSVLPSFFYCDTSVILTPSVVTNPVLYNSAPPHNQHIAIFTNVQNLHPPRSHTQAGLSGFSNETHNLDISYHPLVAVAAYQLQGNSDSTVSAGPLTPADRLSQLDESQVRQGLTPMIFNNQQNRNSQTPAENLASFSNQVASLQHQNSSSREEQRAHNIEVSTSIEENDSSLALPHGILEGAIKRPRHNTSEARSRQVQPRFLCSKCPDFFQSKANRCYHLRACHPEEKHLFPCQHCSASYKSRGSRTVHVRRAHPDKTLEIPQGQS